MSENSHKDESELELSSVELRSKLFQTFKSKGVLQSVKTQLRNRLALELQNKYIINYKNDTRKSSVGNSLFLQISNSLVLDHLKRCSYDYTLSVFVTESLINPEKAVSIDDTLRIMQINPESHLHKKLLRLSQNTIEPQSFLYLFLNLLSNHRNQVAKESSTQTDDHVFQPLTLDAKLEEVERLMRKKSKEDKSIEEKLLNYQRKYEAQKKTELKVEMERFKTSHFALMHVEERDKYQKEIEEIKCQYNENYKKRMEEFERKEEELGSRSNKQKELLETEAYEHRQKILSDLQQLKDREIQMEKNHNMAVRALEMEEDKLGLRKEQLKYKEDALKDIEERYEERLQNEVIKIKFELQQEERQHSENLQMQEQQLRDDKLKFEVQKNIYLRWKTEAEKLKEQNEQQHIALLTSKQTIYSLNEKLEMASEKYKRMDNYDEIINLNWLLERDMAVLQRNFDTLNVEKAQRENEHQKLVKELLNKISRSAELDLVQAKDQENKEKYFREKYYDMQDKYQLEVSKNEEFKKINEDLLLSQRETLREVDELRAALQLANQEKEKYLRMRSTANKLHAQSVRNVRVKPKPRKFHAPVLHTRHISINKDDDYQQQTDTESEKQADVESENNVLVKLEREAMELEQSYKDFQERQRQQLKGSSRVHFNPLIHHRSTSTFDTTDLTRTLEIRASDESIRQLHHDKRYNHINATVLQPVAFNQFNQTQERSSVLSTITGRQPLSSTQTPGEGEASALSFGMSRVTKSNLYQEPPSRRSTIDFMGATESSHQGSDSAKKISNGIFVTAPPALTVTCYSLTQNPLGEATTVVDSLSQYPLYDTRNTLTQYPLADSDITSMTLGRDTKVTIGHNQDIKRNPEGSSISDAAVTEKDTITEKHNSEEHIQNKTNSVEKDLGLKETSIITFESPVKEVTQIPVRTKSDDVFYTPATHLKGQSLEMLSGADEEKTEEKRAKEDSIFSKDEGSLKSNDLKTDNSELSEIKDNPNFPDKEKSEEEEDDLMAKYMKMVLQKKQEEETKEEAGEVLPPVTDLKYDVKVDDIPLSEDFDNGQTSDQTTSEYEW